MPKAAANSVRLYEPDGSLRRWTIQFQPIKPHKGKTVYGDTDWETRTIKINSRVRSDRDIFLAILHECIHVTACQVTSEWFSEALEWNVDEGFDFFKRK